MLRRREITDMDEIVHSITGGDVTLSVASRFPEQQLA